MSNIFYAAPLSLFGRVEFAQLPYVSSPNSTWLSDVKRQLDSAYTGSKAYKGLTILEVENSTTGHALVHHEVFLTERFERDVKVSDYALTAGVKFRNPLLFLHGRCLITAFNFVIRIN